MSVMSSLLIVVLYCVLNFACGCCENAADADMGWSPSFRFAGNDSFDSEIWISNHEDDTGNVGKVSSRALLNNINDVFDNGVDRNQLKATPYYRPSATIGNNNYAYSSINSRPAIPQNDAAHSTLTLISGGTNFNPSQPSPTYQSLQTPVISAPYVQGQGQGYHYPAPQPINHYPAPAPINHYPASAPINQYLPPQAPSPSGQYLPPTNPVPSSQYLPPLPPAHLEIFEASLSNQTTDQFEVNSENLLYVQPGKCSNSIQVGRVRDVEVKTAGYKYNADVQKGICVLMLYAHDELNKLAVSLQAFQGSTNLIPTGSWLQTNVKMYALQAGDTRPVPTTGNFGPGSPALILTKSNIVILSLLIDRAVDFFVNISTYQSENC